MLTNAIISWGQMNFKGITYDFLWEKECYARKDIVLTEDFIEENVHFH